MKSEKIPLMFKREDVGEIKDNEWEWMVLILGYFY